MLLYAVSGSFGRRFWGTSLAGPLYTEIQKEMLYKLFKPVTVCDTKTYIDLPSWGFQKCHSLFFFATEDLPGLLTSCQYIAVNFRTGSKSALFLCLLRSCKSFITLTVLYICKDLWPSPIVNHYPWSNWSPSPCSTFITLPLAVNDLPCTCRALSIPRGMHSSLAFLLWFSIPRFSGISCRSLCPRFHQHSLLIFTTAGYFGKVLNINFEFAFYTLHKSAKWAVACVDGTL